MSRRSLQGWSFLPEQRWPVHLLWRELRTRNHPVFVGYFHLCLERSILHLGSLHPLHSLHTSPKAASFSWVALAAGVAGKRREWWIKMKIWLGWWWVEMCVSKRQIALSCITFFCFWFREVLDVGFWFQGFRLKRTTEQGIDWKII